MRAKFTRWGPKHHYRHAHVTLHYRGRELIGQIAAIERDEVRGAWIATVRHLCGDQWPIRPALAVLNILERTYEQGATE
jgi:ribosomal protein L2